MSQKYKPEEISKVREVLVALYPNCFKPKRAVKLPLKIGIYKDIKAEMKQIGGGLLRASLQDYCGGPKYIDSIVVGAPRYDLAGEVCGEVGPEHFEYAEKLRAQNSDLWKKQADARAAKAKKKAEKVKEASDAA